jgi:hypothetical protein
LLVQSVLTISIPVIAYVVFYFTPEANQSIALYLERRIGGTFNHLQDTKKSHLYLFFKLLLELLAPFTLAIIMWRVFGKRINNYSLDKKSIYVLLLIGISASFPLMVTLEQRAFYLTTSFPYFVIALALAALPFTESLMDTMMDTMKSKNYLRFNRVIVLLIIVASIAVLLNAKKPKRDRDLLADLYLFQETIPPGTTFSIPEELSTKWAYHTYFIRYCYVGIDARLDEPGYVKLDLPLKKFSLFKAASEID